MKRRIALLGNLLRGATRCSRAAVATLFWSLCCGPAALNGQPAALGSDLEALATLHAVSGSEQNARDYVRFRLGGRQRVDNTGSLTAEFGAGSPHTLLIAGLDEPGYAVSGIHPEGYLRLERLADPAPHYEFDDFFVGWPVRVSRRQGGPLIGVVAAPSVHFDSGRNYSNRPTGVDRLYVDIGASSRGQTLEAGVDLLDTVSLERHCRRLGEGARLTAPWISSRAGAAALLRLSDWMKAEPPQGKVTLAFVTQQYYYHRGLVRVLQRVAADRVVLLQPGGGARPTVSATSGWSSQLVDELRQRAEKLEVGLEHGSAARLAFGSFGSEQIWPHPQQSALISVGVANAGTPVEVVDLDVLARVAGLLADLCGIRGDSSDLTRASEAPPGQPAAPDLPHRNSPNRSALTKLIEELTETAGVSHSEAAVRERIQAALPPWARRRASVDEKGNLIVALGAEGGPEAIFIAHMDEIGFKVTSVGSDGRLSVETLGGGSGQLFSWHPMVVHGNSGRVSGIMTEHGWVEIGAKSADEVAARGVEEGAAVTVPRAFRVLGSNRISVRSLDDRIGCSVLLAVLQSLDPGKLPALERGRPVWVVFSVEEEVGLNGARAVAASHSPGRVYAVDSFVTSDSPLESRRKAYHPLGEGFVIRAMDSSGMTPRDEVERIIRLARSQDIPVQYGITSGGNDGSTFVPFGAINIPLSFPLRYAHSPGEVADLRDAEALRRIVRALLDLELATQPPASPSGAR